LTIFPAYKMQAIGAWSLEGRRYTHTYATGYSAIRLSQPAALRFLQREYDRDKRSHFLWDCLIDHIKIKKGKK